MNSILTTLLSYLLVYKYLAIFAVVISSAILLPLPENTLLIATGAFATQGYFNLEISFFVAVAANVLGDSIGYILTRRWGYKIIKEHHIKKYSYLTKVDKYIREQAGLTIFLTRFTGTIGPVVNFLAGVAGVPYGKFLFFDTLGNAVDIALFMGIGYYLGSVWQNFSGLIDIFGWIVLVVVLILISLKFFRKKHVPTEITGT